MKNSKVKKFIGILMIVLYVFFLGTNSLPLIFDDSWGVAKLQTAIEEMDIKYLATHLKIEGQKSSLKADELKDIATLLFDSGYVYQLEYDQYNATDSSIYVKKDGKENIFLNKYVLVLRPYSLVLESDIPEAKVFINGKEIGEIGDDYRLEYGPISPGKHKIEVKYDGEYIKLQEEDEITFLRDYESVIHHSIYLDGDYIYVDSDYLEAKLCVNGKDTGKAIGDIEHFGPIPLDGSIVLQARLNDGDGVIESEEVPVYDDYVYLELISQPEEDPYDSYLEEELFLERTLYELISLYEHGMIDAINFNSFQLVEPYMKKDSPLYKSQKKLVESLNEKGITEKLLDFDILDYDRVADEEIEVLVYEEHLIINSEGKEDVVDHVWTYTVIIDDNDLLLYDIR